MSAYTIINNSQYSLLARQTGFYTGARVQARPDFLYRPARQTGAFHRLEQLITHFLCFMIWKIVCQ